MQDFKIKYMSSEEYFAMEEHAEHKSEYYHGEIFAMAGASLNHNLITSDVITFLNNALRDSDCLVFPSDMRLQIDKDMHYVYPDVSIVCGDVEFADGRDDIIINPVVIIEILSRSTEDYDRAGKFAAYRSVASIKDYVLIDQYSYHIEYFNKIDHNKWMFEECSNLKDKFTIKSINVELALNEIYYRTRLIKKAKNAIAG